MCAYKYYIIILLYTIRWVMRHDFIISSKLVLFKKNINGGLWKPISYTYWMNIMKLFKFKSELGLFRSSFPSWCSLVYTKIMDVLLNLCRFTKHDGKLNIIIPYEKEKTVTKLMTACPINKQKDPKPTQAHREHANSTQKSRPAGPNLKPSCANHCTTLLPVLGHWHAN